MKELGFQPAKREAIMPNQGNTAFPQAYSSHLQTITECMSLCFACARKGLEDGHQTRADICAACAEISSSAIKACCGQSEFEQEILELCTRCCKKCAEVCQKINVKHCQECAGVCSRCAEACCQK